MKIPLRFQITEYDCGTVALQNAINYLYERENIPAELIRAISLYTLDCYDEEGRLGNGGTSVEAMRLMSHWITTYTKSKKFDLEAKHLEKQDVTLEAITDCIKNKGCVLLRTYLIDEHYVVITNIDSKNVYIWDSYYLEPNYYDEHKDIKMVFDQPFSYNRIVSIEAFTSKMKNDFALGPIEKRECVLFNRQNS